MNEKTILITGSTDGIGRQAALEFAATGATVIIHGRDVHRGTNVAEEIRKATGNIRVDLLIADFSLLENVRRLAQDVKDRYRRLDVLVNNAGVFMNDRRMTADGFEMTFAVNYLAPFLLTNLLLDLLKTSAPSRIVNVSSMVHTRGTLDFGNLQGERHFGGYNAYALSKLANILFTFELSDMLEGSGVTCNCLHPGVIGTKLLRAAFNMGGASTADGAETILHLATGPDVEGITGKYFQDNRVTQSAPATLDRALRKELWKLSVKLAGL